MVIDVPYRLPLMQRKVKETISNSVSNLHYSKWIQKRISLCTKILDTSQQSDNFGTARSAKLKPQGYSRGTKLILLESEGTRLSLTLIILAKRTIGHVTLAGVLNQVTIKICKSSFQFEYWHHMEVALYKNFNLN